MTFASIFTNELLGYIRANELNGASKCSWDWKLIVSTLKLTLAWFCPGYSVVLNNLWCSLGVSMDPTWWAVWMWPPCFGDQESWLVLIGTVQCQFGSVPMNGDMCTMCSFAIWGWASWDAVLLVSSFSQSPIKGVAVTVHLAWLFLTCNKELLKPTANISQTLPYHAPAAGEELPRLTL